MKAREIALRIINEVQNNGAYANIALAKELTRHSLQDQDRRFVTELVYGTVKAGETLDWMLSIYVARPLSKIPPVIRNVLRMGIYQLIFMDKVPASAACNQAAELAKIYGHAGTVKFVNGVLRTIARQPERIVYPDEKKEPALFLARKYCHPLWIVERWLKRLGREAVEELCRINNVTPTLTVRTNTLKISREELLARLAQEGVTAEASSAVPEGVVIHAHPALSSLVSLKEGLFQVQDESSMRVAHWLQPQPGELILDVCAAPGGKTTHIATLMENTGRVIALDIHEHKLELIHQNAERLGLSNIEPMLQDACAVDSIFPSLADRVLVDAPCSGFGVLRRRADARWRKKPEMLKELPELQRRILSSAAACVKPGGILVYSTCTTEEEENQAVIGWFLAQHTDFTLAPLPDDVSETPGMLQLWPQQDDSDGFFICRMRRK
ncbi:16S rRNA (cytosine(967)-C(5))-methyltransferase RsmB [Azotosporobacter soli]|uniref:16S rRNA (cytosine(967)-C(5))-methyltransferase RsmB n=1 Tax=Azotosporobacter soli TaxID=3055040 RepID=UPI0031FE5DDE